MFPMNISSREKKSHNFYREAMAFLSFSFIEVFLKASPFPPDLTVFIQTNISGFHTREFQEGYSRYPDG